MTSNTYSPKGEALREYLWNQAIAHGLDPRAVIAVAMSEGGFSGSVGDSGTSYGPFQLHKGGALPAGKTQSWAESKSGLDYAIDRIAKVAKGLTGQQAVSAIVRKFERPANPTGEIQRATMYYQKMNTPVASDPWKWAKSLAKMFGLSVTSTSRPAGTKTAAGYVSDHTVTGRAADIAGSKTAMGMLWKWLKAHPKGVKQAIYRNEQIKDGQVIPYISNDHYDHVHIALSDAVNAARTGGVTRIGKGSGFRGVPGTEWKANPVGDVAGAVGDAANAVMAVPNFLAKLSDSSTWLRVGFGVIGVAALVGSAYLVAKELGVTDTVGKVAGKVV